MSIWSIFGAAAILSVERLCYAWIWRDPDGFRRLCRAAQREPIAALRTLFAGFKVVQAAVFVAWCYWYGGGSLWPPDAGPFVLALGAGAMAAGQVLNLGVFYRLGQAGVFYGNKFGHEIPWCRKFPFSVCDDPQYVGTVLSIWGFFVVMRFPHDDWLVLPVLETIYYMLGARLERERFTASAPDAVSLAPPVGK